MTERGLPIADGATACPFVAFEDDRDARATTPDHRHRCYAEIRPAPRALAHQEAYCLSTAFPVCPTFQDWARREAAQARAATATETAERVRDPGAPPPAGVDDIEGPWPAAGEVHAAGSTLGSDEDAWSGPDQGSSGRNPPRNWAAPPPWLSEGEGAPDDGDEAAGDVQAQPPVRGGGLAGSFADRLAGGGAGPSTPPASRPAATPPPARPAATTPGIPGGVAEAGDMPPDATREPGPRGPTRPRRPAHDDRPASALPGPSWERPRRMEAYPTLKTRIGLPSLSLPPLFVPVLAVVIGAVALFLLPLLLGIGNSPGGAPTASPGPSAGASGSPALPTATPEPTQLVYVVQEGDTMQRIADRFGVTLAALIDANRDAIPNPDLIKIGQQVIIPVAPPTTLPDAGATDTPPPP